MKNVFLICRKVFEEEGIDGEILGSLTENDLKEVFHIDSSTIRQRLLHTIRQLKDETLYYSISFPDILNIRFRFFQFSNFFFSLEILYKKN
jgi:hypothetical protein